MALKPMDISLIYGEKREVLLATADIHGLEELIHLRHHVVHQNSGMCANLLQIVLAGGVVVKLMSIAAFTAGSAIATNFSSVLAAGIRLVRLAPRSVALAALP
jgi:hypothetical protein